MSRDPAASRPLWINVHLVQFKILSRNGAAPGPDDMGRKDTFFFAPGEPGQVGHDPVMITVLGKVRSYVSVFFPNR